MPDFDGEDEFFGEDENRGPQMLRVVFWGSVAIYAVTGIVFLIYLVN